MKQQLFQRQRRIAIFVVCLIFGSGIMAPPALAASSWSPTLLVNTESFQAIDDGDGTTDIELRFGTSVNEKLYWNKAAGRFQFTDDVHVEGNITGSGTLATESDIKTKANLTINSDNGAADAVLTFGNTVAKTLKYDNGDTRFEFDDDVYITGALQTTGNVTVGTTITLGGVAYTFPGADGSASGKVLKTDGAGQLSWATDTDTNTNAQTLCATDEYLDGDGNCVDVIEEGEMDNMAELETQISDNITTQTEGDARYVNTAGDTMTGALKVGNGAALSVSGAVITEGNLSINEDNGDADAVLTFGNDAGAKTLTYSNTNTRFEFNDDVRTTGNLSGASLNIDGNANVRGTLSASGTIRTDGTISGSTLTVDGDITIHGVTYSYPTAQGAANTFLKNDGAGNLTWTTTSVGNGSGGILSLHPEYPNAVYFSSGATFIGQLSASGGVAGINENYYHWTSSKSTMQDYWIAVRVRLPDNFSAWDPVKPVELRYRTGSGQTTGSLVGLRMKDTENALVTLTGAEGLANTSFTTATITGPQAAGTWTPKGYITVYVKLAGRTTGNGNWFAEVGFLNLNFETTTP